MSLELTITSYQRLSPGQEVTKVIDQGTMVIGRAPDNDWVLPDPERYLSGKHCIIEYRDGDYFITDTSTNGVFINDAKEPLGRGKPVKLNDGDHLTLGDYEIKVTIRRSADDTDIISSAQLPDDWFQEHDPSASNFINTSPLTKDLFDDLKSPSERGAEPNHLPPERESFEPPSATPELIPENWWDSLDRRKTEIPPVEPTPKPSPSTLPSSKPSKVDKAALQAFLAGAGVEQVQIPDAEICEFMAGAGTMFRQMVQGLRELLIARSSIKGEFRLSQTTIRPLENNPLKFSVGVDDVIIHLLGKQSAAYLAPEQAIREGVNDIKAHQMAMMAGMQAALSHLLRRFDPQRLEKRLGQQSVLDNILPGSRKARYWDLFNVLYDEIVREAEDEFQELFGKEFARAYEEQVRKL